MYISRLYFYSSPSKTLALEQNLKNLLEMAVKAGGKNCKILRAHFASPGTPDVIFEQEAIDLTSLEDQINKVMEGGDFQKWSEETSTLLEHSPKREVYLVVEQSK
jgi:hypothetical protein